MIGTDLTPPQRSSERGVDFLSPRTGRCQWCPENKRAHRQAAMTDFDSELSIAVKRKDGLESEGLKHFLVEGAPVVLAGAVDQVVVLAASVCWLSCRSSLAVAPAASLFHIEVKMTLVGLIGTRSQHRAKYTAGVFS